ncbi:alpha-L-rhamnosidase-related protein [Tessaracoccus sp.]
MHLETPNQLLLFRRTIHLSEPIKDAVMWVSAHGSFRVWANGHMLAHHDLQGATPGSQAIRIDLSPALQDATCEMRIVIAVHLLAIGTHHQPRSLGGLFVAGCLLDGAGSSARLDSSPQWESCTPDFWKQNTSQMAWSTGYTEWWDHTSASGDVAGALRFGEWSSPVIATHEDPPTRHERDVHETAVNLMPFRTESGRVRTPTGAFASRAAECVASGSQRRNDATIEGEADQWWGYHLFILEHQSVGFLELTLDSDQACTVDVIAGERLDAHGWPTAMRQGIEAIDTLVVPAGATTHRFWHRRTFRAMALVVRHQARVSVRDAVLHTVTAERSTPSLETGDPLLDNMFATSVITAEIGRQDFYEDCPLREGGHYVADARVQALFDLLSTGSTSLARRSIKQFADTQDSDGMIPALSPSGTRHRIPDFALQWVCYLEDYVRLTEDVVLLGNLLPNVDACLDWAEDHWDPDAQHFALDQPGWWPFIDWYSFEPDALQSAVDAQYLVTLHAGGNLMERLGEHKRAERYHALALEQLGRLRTDWHHPHAVVTLLTGLPPSLALAHVDMTALDGFVADTGYWNFWLCLAHINAGHPEHAWQVMHEYWGSMLKAGARTWWERFAIDREVTESTEASLCHPWSAGPLLLLPMLLSGTNPLARDAQSSEFPPIRLDRPPFFRMRTPSGFWMREDEQ